MNRVYGSTCTRSNSMVFILAYRHRGGGGGKKLPLFSRQDFSPLFANSPSRVGPIFSKTIKQEIAKSCPPW